MYFFDILALICRRFFSLGAFIHALLSRAYHRALETYLTKSKTTLLGPIPILS